MATAVQEHPKAKRPAKKRAAAAVRAGAPTNGAVSDTSRVSAAVMKRRRALLKRGEELRAELKARGHRFQTVEEILHEVEVMRERENYA